MVKSAVSSASRRPTSWWLRMLQRRAERMYDEKLDLSEPIVWESEAERLAAIAFFNAAFRSEEAGLRQAHELAEQVASWDPELAECLRLYGNEEGWHRELMTEFLEYLGGSVKPMGRVTGTFYRVYSQAKRIETIVMTNLMFETIGSTTYRLALRRAKHPQVRHVLTILTRDESFHVPLNVHFLREALSHETGMSRTRLKFIYNLLFVALIMSSYASRRRAFLFDQIPFEELSRAYAEHMGRLFLQESDLDLRPPKFVLWLLGLSADELLRSEDTSAVSIQAAEAAIDRDRVNVTAL